MSMMKLNLTYEIEGTTIHPIDLNTMQHTNLDKTNLARRLRAMLLKLPNCPTKNSQNMPNHWKPLMWTRTLSMATTKELFRQQI